MLEFLDPQNEIGGDGLDDGLNKKSVGDVCLCKNY